MLLHASLKRLTIAYFSSVCSRIWISLKLQNPSGHCGLAWVKWEWGGWLQIDIIFQSLSVQNGYRTCWFHSIQGRELRRFRFQGTCLGQQDPVPKFAGTTHEIKWRAKNTISCEGGLSDTLSGSRGRSEWWRARVREVDWRKGEGFQRIKDDVAEGWSEIGRRGLETLLGTSEYLAFELLIFASYMHKKIPYFAVTL